MQQLIRVRALAMLVAAAALAVTVAACGSGDSASGGSGGGKDAKIGLITARSGVVALAGKSFRQGVEFGVAQFNADDYIGDGRKIELVEKEGAEDPTRSVAQEKQLITDKSVSGVICCVLSPVAGAVSRLAESAKMPLDIYGATEAGLQNPPYIYRTATLPQPANAALGKEVAEKMKPKSAVYMTTSDNAGMVSQMEAFKKSFDDAGVQSRGVIKTLADQTDFNGAATEAIAAKADVIVASALNGPNVSFIKAVRNRGYKGLIIAGETISASGTFKASGGTLVGVPFPVYFYAGTENPVGKKFADDYQAKYGEAADSYAAQGYIAAQLMAEGVKNGGGDVSRESLTKGLGDISSLSDTVFGDVKMEGGQLNAENAIEFIQYDKSGKLVPWEPPANSGA